MGEFFLDNNYSVNLGVGYSVNNVGVNDIQQAPENNAIEQNPVNVLEAGEANRQIENPNAVKPQWQARLDKMLIQAAQKRNPYVNVDALKKTIMSSSVALTEEQRATIDSLNKKVTDSLSKLDNIKLQDLLKVASLKNEDIQDEQLKSECEQIRQTIYDACNAQTELANAIRLIGSSAGQQKYLENIDAFDKEQNIQKDNSVNEDVYKPQDMRNDGVSTMFNPTGKTGPRSIGGRNDGVST
ncbi:MAG: hypothetical protein MJ202_09535, partial [Lentisphaeria bacterium]|nr:hypothetical protein [Lentisphaeria bacterium]